ncbi:MAG: DotU family type IV/VI secretion system protein [Pirellulaceae bacterium]|nr:DotU family type IV/VI secretion system protein [Pirellulaceae bacterium]
MNPKHALAVDPYLLHALDLLDRISLGYDPNPQDERVRLRALLDQGEAIAGRGRDWELSSYALVAWIDEMLVEASWAHSEWWSNNVLERELFHTRECAERFFINAKEASTLPQRDALEVHYICVVLGFRGIYSQPAIAAMVAESLSIPADLSVWARQVSMSIRLGQGRPTLKGPVREIHGAPPLPTKNRVVWPWLFAAILAAWNVIYVVLHFAA